MRLKKGFKVREIAGNYMLVPYGKAGADFTCIFSLSEASAWLWNALQDRDFDEAEAVALIEGEYDVDHTVAETDVALIVKSWAENGVLDG